MEIILDYSKWRCGLNGPNKVGKGETALLNQEGFMCCLGQASEQLNSELRKEDLLNRKAPGSLQKVVPGLSSDSEMDTKRNTGFSYTAMRINDDEDTTPEEKINILTKLFPAIGHTLKVINNPNE